MRHLVDKRDVGVDPHSPKLEPASHAQRAADVAGPDRGRQAVVHRVRPFQRLLLVGEALDCNHRAEHLTLHDLGIGSGGEDDGRLIPPTGTLDAGATRGDLGAGFARAVDEAGHPLELLLRDQRSHVGVGCGRVADLQ